VTHNQAEALETGDRIAVMEQGKIVQVGDPHAIYHRPENEFVARFIGDMNIFRASFNAGGDGDVSVDTPFGRLAAQSTSLKAFGKGDDCVVGIRPEDIEIKTDHPAEDSNLITGVITASNFVGEGFVHTVEAAGQKIRVKLHHKENVNRGDTVQLRFPPRQTVVVSPAEDLDSTQLEGEALDGAALGAQ